jgi:hypothetical protein
MLNYDTVVEMSELALLVSILNHLKLKIESKIKLFNLNGNLNWTT